MENSCLMTDDVLILDTVNNELFRKFRNTGVVRYSTSVVSRMIPINSFDAQCFCSPTELCCS